MTDDLCICGLTVDNEECSCSVKSSDDIAVSGSGKTGFPFTFDPILDPSEDNLITCEGDGMLLKLPDDLITPPQAHAYNSANQSISDDINTIVALNSERYDTDSMHSTVTNNERLTFNTPGIYLCTFRGAFAGNTAGDRWMYIRRNSREIMGGEARKALNSASFELDMVVTVVEFFDTNEYIHAEVKQDSGGALNLLADRTSPILTAKWLRGSPYD